MNFCTLLLTNIGTTISVITDNTDRYEPIITSVVSVVSVVTSVIPVKMCFLVAFPLRTPVKHFS